jgi:DNA-binding NtrC family response regulator
MAVVADANATLRLPPEDIIFGQTEAMRLVRSKLERVALTNIPVLIQGENGTGKEILARMIHSSSPWATGAFVKIHCPTAPGTLLGNEGVDSQDQLLLGLARPKPDPVDCKVRPFLPGLEPPYRGTLFLDEVAELNSACQAKLLQFFQQGQYCGSEMQASERGEARIVCATSRNLQDEIKAGNFRPDLLFHINVFTLKLPSLRERRVDFPALAHYFLAAYNARFHSRTKPLSARCMRLLQEYHWPGNIRELENLIKRYVVLGSEDAVSSELFPREVSGPASVIPLDGSVPLKKVTRQTVRELERKVILGSLQANNWNRKRVAQALGISYRALLYKIRDAGIGLRSEGMRPAGATPDLHLPVMELDRAS